MVWVRFMNGQINKEKTPARHWNWLHRGFDYDIKEATEDD